MQFIQNGILAALAAMIIPIIIHLLFKRRSHRVNLGTLRFLRKVLEENARRRKLKRWLLLALRMAAVGLLVLLFARPFLPEVKEVATGNLRVILIDRSATMALQQDGQRLIDQAVARAKELASAEDETNVRVAWFDKSVQPVEDVDTLEAPESLSGSTSYGAALAWARDLLAANDAEKKELHVLTDLQRSGLDWIDTEPMPPEVAVHVDDFGREVVNNIAIVDQSSHRTLIRPGDTFETTVTLLNEAVFPVDELPIHLKLRQGSRTISQRQQLKLEAGAVVVADFLVDDLQPGLWRGLIELADVTDDLPFDNQRHFAVMVANQIPVLIVDGQPHESPLLAGSYFLESAVRLAPRDAKFAGSPYVPQVVDWTGVETKLPDLTAFPIVVLSNVSEPGKTHVSRLEAFVKAGGKLLVFAGNDTKAEPWNALEASGVLPAKFGPLKVASDLPWRIDDWEPNHPAMEPFNDPQRGDVRRVAFNEMVETIPADNATVVAKFRGDIPAILERSYGEGKTIVFASGADLRSSQWPRSSLYVPMVHQMLGYLSGLAEGGPIRKTIVAEPNSASEPGVHQRGDFFEVANISPRESETDRVSINGFAERFGLTLATEEESTPTTEASLAGAEIRENEIWPMFLLVLLCVLGLESMLANRTLA